MVDCLEFEKIEVPFDRLSELNISSGNVLEEYYSGLVYVSSKKIHCDNLYLDKFMKNGNDGSIYVFKEEVTVDNALIQEETDYGPTVFFLKKVKAKNIWLGGGIISFENDVEVDQTFIGVYNHGEVFVKGQLSAEVVVCSDHCMSISKWEVRYVLGYDDSEFNIEDVLQSKYYNKWDEYIDDTAILKAIKKGVSIVSTKPVMTQLQKRFEKMKKASVKKLDLSYLELREIPKEVWEIRDLVSLNISGAYIDSLPSEISNLTDLQVLSISDCNFTTFPMEILGLEKLVELDISFMPLKELPEGFEKLSLLKKLNFMGCEFSEVPTVLEKLPSLTHLDFSKQECDNPIVFDLELPKLKTLSVALNQGISLRSKLENLVSLNLTNCRLQEFPMNVLEMRKLSTLYMSFNYFYGFPEEFVQLNGIKDLAFDLMSINEQEITMLKEFSVLKTIKVNNREVPSNKIEILLVLPIWTKLYTDYRIENMYVGKQILERKSLELVMSSGEKWDLKDQRKMYGIVL